MKFIVLAGGSGTRLWPLSRKNFPKQFLKLPVSKENPQESFFQKTIKRLAGYKNSEIFVITNEKYKFYVFNQIDEILRKINSNPKIHVVLEPASKNTAPAIALGVKFALENGASISDVFMICPSDHLISPDEEFLKYIEKAEMLAQKGYIVTFGIIPKKPETGYGYIKVKSKELGIKNKTFHRVESFTEKPDLETAKQYLKQGNYYWNSGMFAFTASLITNEFKKYIPEIGNNLELSYAEFLDKFKEFPEISIDYAIMEKTDKAVLLPLSILWSDIGSWESLYDILEKDEQGNAATSEHIKIDTKNTMILGNKRFIATIALEDTIVVETEDALLIAKKGECQKVKDIVNALSEKGSSLVEEHVVSYRPWGSFTLLEKGERYKIKRITVSPEASLSLQMHHHRSEHWIVVKGTAKVTIGNKEIFVHENESVYVPKSTLHRLENPGKIPLEIIEVQVGEYVEEDDIKRFEDVYGRQNI
ncbi:mannose-1-phosphate guanylyltransferase/mannose-6-phosphate isomerase [Thermodesulfovibrio hydrogeniphilus]